MPTVYFLWRKYFLCLHNQSNWSQGCFLWLRVSWGKKNIQAFNIPSWILDSFYQSSSLYNVLMDLPIRGSNIFLILNSVIQCDYLYIVLLSVFVLYRLWREICSYYLFGFIYILWAFLSIHIFIMNRNIYGSWEICVNKDIHCIQTSLMCQLVAIIECLISYMVIIT